MSPETTTVSKRAAHGVDPGISHLVNLLRDNYGAYDETFQFYGLCTCSLCRCCQLKKSNCHPLYIEEENWIGLD